MFVVIPVLCLAAAGVAYDLLRYRQVAAMIEASPKIRTAMIQGNIEQDQKWSPAMRQETMDVYISLSEKALAQGSEAPVLLVWPETALPFLIDDNPYFAALKEGFIEKKNIWLLSGAPYFKKQESGNSAQKRPGFLSYNSAYLFNPDGEIGGRYDKQHLVPFGEYVPLADFLPLPGPLVESIGSFSPGKPSGPLACQDAKIGVLICFESIFPELARNWTDSGADLLVNITNDAWFGRSSAPWQHLSMTVFRAVENRRSVIRSANTGISTAVDPLGRMAQASPLFQPYSLVADADLLQVRTVFVSFGHYFGLLCLLASIPLAFFAKKGKQPGT